MIGAATLPEIEGVTIGRTVSLDPRSWQAHAGETCFELDRCELPITAQGLIRLDDGSHLHRFYTDEEVMLQVMSRGADGSGADDFTLFQPWSSTTPTDGWQSQAFLDRMRRAWWEEPGVPPYRRFWFEGNDLDQPPVRIVEAVYEDRSGPPVRHVTQTCMLYSRPLSGGGSELLLALDIEGDASGAITQEVMIGLPLSPAQFHA